MDDARESLVAALHSLVGEQCKKSNAVNSLRLSFDFQNDEKGRVYIWIDPPWRLTHDNSLITGSADWPEWDGKDNPAINRPVWVDWCAIFDVLSTTSLRSFSVAPGLPDLRLQFASGHAIETFGNYSDTSYWWYYRDRIKGDVYEASAGGITYELAEPAKSLPLPP